MRAWYIPSATGDFRLEAHPDEEGQSILTVEDPTAAELEQLSAFLRKCRQYKWVDDLAGVARTGRSELRIQASVGKAGKYLAGNIYGGVGALTVVASVAGKITATVAATDDDAETALAVATVDTDAEGKNKPADQKPAKAVTVPAPTRCCPSPVEGPLQRSSRVLREFCTPRQWTEWVKQGFIHVTGGTTGYTYRVVHRHHPLASTQGKMCWDVTNDHVMHFYNWLIPPAEEVLAALLILQHREPWLRTSSTCLLGPRDGVVFPNLLGDDFLDGTADAHLFASLGHGVQLSRQLRES